MSKKFYTVRQVAEVLNVSYLTAFRKITNKQIPSIRLGRKILIPTTFVDNLVTQALSGVHPQGAA
jgi:excisionase family DNA binding protein